MNHHQHHEHKMQSMGHGSAASFLHRFWVVTFLLVPLLLLQPQVANWFGWGEFALRKWLQFGIATIIFGFSLIFFQHAWHEIKTRNFGMMTLVSLAVSSGYLFSVVSTFLPSINTEFYIEISTLIWVLLFGHYLEAKSSMAAGDALSEVAKLLPKQAHKLENGKEIQVSVVDLKVGDKVIVKPGEKIPADGVIVEGIANINEALISGESAPIKKTRGAEVVAGSICLDGALTIELTRVGEHSTVGQIKQLIATAGQTKPRSQKLADKAAAILTLTAGITALGTLLVWTLILGQPFVFAMTLAITVLVIACPHALGLAIPTVTTITTSLAVKNGFFIKDLSKIETIRKADYVVFDKTGTLTKGEFGVVKVVSTDKITEDKLISITASIEKQSSHIIAQSILRYAEENNLTISQVSDFKNIAGQGIQASLDGQTYYVGNAQLMRSFGVVTDPVNDLGTVVFVSDGKNLLGYLILSDTIKQSAYEAVNKLHRMGVKVAMLTGDNELVAQSVAQELGIDTYFAEVMPDKKYTHIKNLQADGNVVLMVGDGVNDAPALIQANAGIAIGAGTDVAVESGDVVLTDSDPEDVVRLLKLAKKVYVKMWQNLFWALGYNVIAIPAAAGVFAIWGFFLRPEIGALVMSLSTVIVVANALTLRRFKI